MQPRSILTDRKIASLPPAAPGKRYFHQDALLPGFGVRVTDTGAKSYSVYRRWPGPISTPSHRKVGTVGKMSLKDARALAKSWIELAVVSSIDPREELRRAEKARQRQVANTFGMVAEEWLTTVAMRDRQYADVRKRVEAEFLPIWGKKPMADITEEMVAEWIKAKGKKAPASARNLLIILKRLFRWAKGQPGRNGMTSNPAAELFARDLIGHRGTPRERVLNDDELRAVWGAAALLPHPYPFGEMLRMLILTGCRLREVANARRREFDLKKRLWTIPAARMKTDAAHVIPMCDELYSLVSRLPRFNRGEYLFSTNSGEKPVTGFARAKERIDERVPRDVPKWTFHDLRRTMRTRLSNLPIEEHVRERMIAHAQPTITRVYVPDVMAYFDAKRDGFALWEAALLSVVRKKAMQRQRLSTACI